MTEMIVVEDAIRTTCPQGRLPSLCDTRLWLRTTWCTGQRAGGDFPDGVERWYIRGKDVTRDVTRSSSRTNGRAAA
jgi:hypothetical protein